MTANPPANLLDFDAEGLTRFVAGLGEKPFRARQLERWIHQRGERDFERMSDLAKAFRTRLQEAAVIEPPRVIASGVSADGTHKWLLDVGGGNGVEAGFIPEDGRGTLCVSTPAGCPPQRRFSSPRW